jgi:hypothetical protein
MRVWESYRELESNRQRVEESVGERESVELVGFSHRQCSICRHGWHATDRVHTITGADVRHSKLRSA